MKDALSGVGRVGGGVLSASKVRADDADGVVSAFARHVHEDVLV